MFKNVDRRLLTILSIVFVQLAGAAMILPILPLFAEREFSMPPATITLLVSAYFAAQFFAGPYLGQLSDRYGRVPLLVISQFGSAVSFFMIAAAGNIWLLFAARILDGITGGNIIVAQAYITDITPKEKRTQGLGYIYAVFGLGFIVGPALGGLLSAWLGPRLPFVIAGAAALLTAVMSWLLLDETVTTEGEQAKSGRRKSLSLSVVRSNSSLLLTLVVGFVGQFALGLLQSTFALYGSAVLFASYSDQVVNLGVGLLLAVVGAAQFVTQIWLLGPLKERFGDGRLVILGTSSRALGLLLFAVLPTIWAAAIASLFFAFGQGVMMPPLQSIATRTMPEEIRGAVLGVFQSSVSLATIVSTAIAGVIFSLQASVPFWLGAGLSLLVVWPAFVLLQRSQGGELKPSEVTGPTG